MQEQPSKPNAPKYADSSISDKAFKRMLLWFFIYCSLFCICVVLAINADMGL